MRTSWLALFPTHPNTGSSRKICYDSDILGVAVLQEGRGYEWLNGSGVHVSHVIPLQPQRRASYSYPQPPCFFSIVLLVLS